MTASRMRFGIFLSPYHATGQSPTVALERDLQLLEHIDQLGFDEAWIGEHHSGGFELIASPEVFIAVAAQRTRHIRLGTGVMSVPYHHPLLLADRMVLLDHLTRGRIMMGTGPGALITDARMMGIDPQTQRQRHEEGLEAIIRLLRGETVNQETDWFTLNDARLQMAPYQDPCFEILAAAVRSPSGPRLAGRFGLGLISLAATDPSGGFDFLKDTWPFVEERAKEFNVPVDRRQWRLLAPIHLSTTKEQAYEDVQFGLVPMMRFGSAGPFAGASEQDIEEVIATTSHKQVCNSVNDGYGAIGTPDMAIEMIHRLQSQTDGGFGTLLLNAHEWADSEATRKSYELFARYVMPEFQGSAIAPADSFDRLYSDRMAIAREFRGAQDKATADHQAEQQKKQDERLSAG